MKKQLFFVLFSVILLSIQSQTTVIDSIYSGGIYRNYRLYIPAIYNGSTARPLILNLHGYTSNASQQQLYSNFMPIADTANFLMVYPNGTSISNQPFWNAGISSSLVNDINFLSELIDSLKLLYNIDLNRVYSTGMSNGGFMSHTLACELSHKITAIASVTGSIFTQQYGSSCHPTRPIPVMQIHGTADATVPYSGNSTMEPIDSVVRYWVLNNGCNVAPSFSNVPNTNTTDGCTAQHYVYANGNLGSSVELFKIIGGTHSWPGFPFGGVGTNLDINASVEIWRFFRKYQLDLLTSLSDNYHNDIEFSLYPNPSNSVLNISFNNSENLALEVCVTDIIGNNIILQNNRSNAINIESLNAGIYFLLIKQQSKLIVKRKFVKY